MVTINDYRPLNDITHSFQTPTSKRTFERKEFFKGIHCLEVHGSVCVGLVTKAFKSLYRSLIDSTD